MQQSNRQESESTGACEDLEEEKGDSMTTDNNDDGQHKTIKQNTVEVG